MSAIQQKILFISICSFFSIIQISAQDTRAAVEYMKEIGEHYEAISKDMWDYTSTFAHSRSARKIEKKRMSLLQTIKDARSTVKKMGAFDKDYSLRDSVVAYFALTYNVLNDDFDKIIDMEEVAEQSYDLMEAYLLAQELANDKLEQASARMEIQYKAFADKYGINLVDSEDKISKKLEMSSHALKYYNQVYLVFFKAYKQEIYLLDAMERADVNSIEQNRNALKSISDEGLTKLEEIGSYKGNSVLIVACKRLMNFYKSEAEDDIPFLADFIISSQEYKEMVNLFESKDRMLITNEEVEKYNAAVDKYNKGVNKFNSTHQRLNGKREQNLNYWNSSVESFMERYIPKR